MADELLAVIAARDQLPGHAFPAPDASYEEFEARFRFDDTPDQRKATDDVLGDMQRARPMDRLVCGDVGFGKTEVACRAAYLAAAAGKQVAFLVPTTVLCQQHLETLRERFAETAISVAALSRMTTPKQLKEVREGLASGKLDVVIGTHRLLSKDIVFRNLGLVIVDEEHRFGVAHKERLKQLRKLVDVLTLTATPIPRTLQMAFSGMRDLSVIQTPPPDRIAVRTQVARVSEELIREAVDRELHRGGQVFFVHNRIETIGEIADYVRRTVPSARIAVAHGQMSGHTLEKTMLAFLRRDYDVLVCTAIIESGLDIPNANTILIHRADMFGLAQLYQLRGRVGRSNRRAYAYLLLPASGQICGRGAPAHRGDPGPGRARRGLPAGDRGPRDPRRGQPARRRAVRPRLLGRLRPVHGDARAGDRAAARRGAGRRDRARDPPAGAGPPARGATCPRSASGSRCTSSSPARATTTSSARCAARSSTATARCPSRRRTWSR